MLKEAYSSYGDRWEVTSVDDIVKGDLSDALKGVSRASFQDSIDISHLRRRRGCDSHCSPIGRETAPGGANRGAMLCFPSGHY